MHEYFGKCIQTERELRNRNEVKDKDKDILNIIKHLNENIYKTKHLHPLHILLFFFFIFTFSNAIGTIRYFRCN